MPIYEYRCKKCGAQLEVFQKMSDKPPARCRKCGGRLEKMISSPAIQFKGEGWYVTDYASKDKRAERAQKESASSESSTTSAGTDKSSGDKDKPKKPTKKADKS